MHDTTNLKKRLKECQDLLVQALIKNDHSNVNYYNSEIETLKKKIAMRNKNTLKNKKAFKKAHGYLPKG